MKLCFQTKWKKNGEDFQKRRIEKNRNKNQNRKQEKKEIFIRRILVLGLIGAMALGGCSKNSDNFEAEQMDVSETTKNILETTENVSEVTANLSETMTLKTETKQQTNSEQTEEMRKEEAAVFYEEDWYRNSVQNLRQGNSITYADGYYYFCSQYDYSLCRSKGIGEEVEVLADQMPAEICIFQDMVYFINASDGQTLYCVKTDGGNLTKLGDFPMQNMILLGERIYFLSVYDREEDPFYQLVEEKAEGDRYLYSVNLDGSDCRLLAARVCEELTTDGVRLYYICQEENESILYRSDMDGEGEAVIWQGEEWILNLVPYQGRLYSCVRREKVWYFSQLEENGEWKTLEKGSNFFIAEGCVYLYNRNEIWSFSLEEEGKANEEKRIAIEIGKKERESGFLRGENEGIFFVNGSIFCKCWESEEKGIVWHIWEEESQKFFIFEEIEPFERTMLVKDTSQGKEQLFYKPGESDDIQYLDGELHFEESYGVEEDGTGYGVFSLKLPLFGAEISGSERINQMMREVEKLALEDRDSFFQEMKEAEEKGWECKTWYRRHSYYDLYVGEHYISFYYYVTGYSGGMRAWEEAVPLTFDRETGEFLTMDQLFTVDRTVYMKRLTSAIYKYGELDGEYYFWNEGFYRNVLVKNFKPGCFYLTQDGIVLCYQRYAVAPGAAGNPAFEIPYSWFDDIFIGKSEEAEKETSKSERKEKEQTAELSDSEFYQTVVQNFYKGNSMVYADGYYYFRSQADYSLCRMRSSEKEAEVLADQMPTDIGIYQNRVYFINASDKHTLYCVGTDGTNLTKLGDFPMYRMLIAKERIYFISIYKDREEWYHSLCSVNLDGSDYQVLVSAVCKEFITDGENLYYILNGGKETILYQSDMDGGEKIEIWRGEEQVFNLVFYQETFYGCIRKEDHYYFVSLTEEGKWEVFQEGRNFLISEGCVYLYNENEILSFCLKTGEKREQIRMDAGKEREMIFSRGGNEDFFLVNGDLFLRCWESEEKGILWHIWDKDAKNFILFEDIKPLEGSQLVKDSFWNGGTFYTPGQAEDVQYLEGEVNWKESYGVKENGEEFGIFSFALPLFGAEIQGREKIHLYLKQIEEQAFEEKESFFKEIHRLENGGDKGLCESWIRQYGYSNLYVGERCLSFFYFIRSYSGMHPWQEAIPMTFDRKNGECLTMDELFTVDKTVYMKRLTSAVYKYTELSKECYYWKYGFDWNVLTEEFEPNCFYLTPDGIVLCYGRYTITDKHSDDPAFEIPYSWFDDIFVKK